MLRNLFLENKKNRSVLLGGFFFAYAMMVSTACLLLEITFSASPLYSYTYNCKAFVKIVAYGK